VPPRFLREATTRAEALELVSEGSMAGLMMPSAQNAARERVVFRQFLDEFLTAEIGLAYLGENPFRGSHHATEISFRNLSAARSQRIL
jgi:hypothetical protein